MFLPHKLPSSEQQTSGRSLREPLEMQRRMKVVCSHASKAFRCLSLGQREFLGWFSSPIKDVPLQINNSIFTGKEACTCSHNKGECPHSHVEELWSVSIHLMNQQIPACVHRREINYCLLFLNSTFSWFGVVLGDRGPCSSSRQVRTGIWKGVFYSWSV